MNKDLKNYIKSGKKKACEFSDNVFDFLNSVAKKSNILNIRRDCRRTKIARDVSLLVVLLGVLILFTLSKESCLRD